MEFNTLETPHVVVRTLSESDLAGLVAYRCDPDVARYQDWNSDFSQAEARSLLPNLDDPELGTPGRWTQLAIAERESGRLCGDIGIHFLEEQPLTVEVGITLSGEFQGDGYGFEAMRSVIDWLFSEFGLHRVFAHVDVRNAPARALLGRLGLRQEAELIEADWFKGQWTTLCMYAVLAGERPD